MNFCSYFATAEKTVLFFLSHLQSCEVAILVASGAENSEHFSCEFRTTHVDLFFFQFIAEFS